MMNLESLVAIMEMLEAKMEANKENMLAIQENGAPFKKGWRPRQMVP
jgi:hypothetical protein